MAVKAKKKKPNAVQAFFRETTIELGKVSWPTWTKAKQLSGLVILVMIFVGIILGLTDGAARGLLALLIG